MIRKHEDWFKGEILLHRAGLHIRQNNPSSIAENIGQMRAIKLIDTLLYAIQQERKEEKR